MAHLPPELPAALPDDQPAAVPSGDAIGESWSDLEHGFFASAPPDVPEPAPEPMRFDDLEPLEPPPPSPWQVRLSRAWLATAGARQALRAAGRAAYRRSAPLVVGACRRGAPLVAGAWRRTSELVAAVLRRTAPALAALRIGARDHRLMAAGAAALVVVMGISAVVVASRGGGPVTTASAPLLAGAACPMASEEAPPLPVEMSASASELAESPETLAPDPVKPRVRHKRKHAQPPARRRALPTQAKPGSLR